MRRVILASFVLGTTLLGCKRIPHMVAAPPPVLPAGWESVDVKDVPLTFGVPKGYAVQSLSPSQLNVGNPVIEDARAKRPGVVAVLTDSVGTRMAMGFRLESDTEQTFATWTKGAAKGFESSGSKLENVKEENVQLAVGEARKMSAFIEMQGMKGEMVMYIVPDAKVSYACAIMDFPARADSATFAKSVIDTFRPR